MQAIFITRNNAHQHKEHIRAFHEARHDIFIESVGRDDLNHTQKFEYDIWDTQLFDAVSVLLIDEGQAIGVARLVSSEEMTMLEANHQEFLWEMHDKRPDLWEIQRLGIRRELSPIVMERAILFLLSEISIWCLQNGIKDIMLLTYSGIAQKRLTEMQVMGPELPLIGAPHVALIGELKRKTITEWMQRYYSLTDDIPKTSAA